LNVKATLPYSQTQTLKFGADYNRYRLNDWWPEDSVNHMPGMSPGTFLNINNGQRDRIGLFSEVVSQWSDRLSSIFGVRYDRVTMNTDDVHGYNGYSGFIGANNNDPVDAAYFNALEHKKVDNNFDITAMGKYVYSKNSDIELGFSRKTRSPNMYERYSWAGSSRVYTNPIHMDMRMVNWFGDGNGYVGNLNLDPEVANSISATLSLHDSAEKEWGLKLTPYYTKVKDYIDIDLVNTSSSGINYFQFINTDAHLFGADLSGYTTLSDTVDNGKVTLKGSMSYTRGFRDNGGSLYHMMPFHAKISLDRVSGAWNNGIDIESVAQKSSVDTLRKEPLTPGYALVDVRTGYAWSKQLNMDFSVTNFFNKAYAMPLGGIDTVNYKANTYTPLQGMGRSFNAALSYKF
jgi:iron complex outermembrane receptor protein